MKQLVPFLLFLLLAGCSPEAIRTRQWKRYVADLKKQPPVPPDTTTGAYLPNDELEVLDGLLQKYPGKQKVRVVTKVETLTLPGKTVYVEVPVKVNVEKDKTERDSLLTKLESLVQRERADSEIRAEVARLRVNLLRAFNARACLPDTTVRFDKYDLQLTIKRGVNGRYGFTWQEGARSVSYNAQVTEQHNGRLVVTPKPPWWRDEWFWAMVFFAGCTLWLGYLRLRDAAPSK